MPVIPKGYIITDKCCDKTRFYDTLADFPETGLVSRLYVDRSTGNIYVWDGSEYITADVEKSYYTNSYVERLKGLGSTVQFSNYTGAGVNNVSLLSGGLYLNSFFINKETTINSISWRQNTQGSYTSSGYNGIGIYSVDKLTGTLSLLGSSLNDGDIWKATSSTFGNKALSAPLAVQPGVYYIGLLFNNSAVVTAPIIARSNALQIDLSGGFNNYSLPNNLAISTKTTTTHTSLPTSILSSDFDQATANDFLYWVY